MMALTAMLFSDVAWLKETSAFSLADYEIEVFEGESSYCGRIRFTRKAFSENRCLNAEIEFGERQKTAV